MTVPGLMLKFFYERPLYAFITQSNKERPGNLLRERQVLRQELQEVFSFEEY